MADGTSIYGPMHSTRDVRISSTRHRDNPWKPYPPKRGISSLSKADFVGVTPPGGTCQSKSRDAAVPEFVSIVPIDTNRQRIQRLPRQQRTENDTKMTESEYSGSTPSRNSLVREAPVSYLYDDHRHGFNVRRNLNLRAKNPSRDRWAMTTGSNLDPYLFEDDFKVNSINCNQKLEAGVKVRRNASFLLCASRKSLKSAQKDGGVQPFWRTSDESEMPSHRPNGMSELPSKRNKISSAKIDNAIDFGKQKTDHVTTESSALTSSHLPSVCMVKPSVSMVKPSVCMVKPSVSMEMPSVEPASDHRHFFPSVATLSRRQTFWAGVGPRNARPVLTPRLAGPVSATQIPGPFQTARRVENATGELDTKYSRSNRDSSGEISIENLERKTERNSQGDLRDSKAGIQRQRLPSNLTQKTFSVVTMSGKHESLEKTESLCSRDFLNKEIHCKTQSLNFDSSDLSNDCRKFPMGDLDGSSLRSSATSDWFSARDCTSSSICVESINSDPVNSECDSDKSSTTWLSKVKKVFTGVWSILVPSASAKKPVSSSSDVDFVSDVDSGCSVGADQDLAGLQCSPGDMSELQKLAALANRIADRKRKKESFDISYSRHLNYVPSYDLGQLPTSASRAGSPRDLECIFEMAEGPSQKPSSDAEELIACGRNQAFPLSAETSLSNSHCSSSPLPFDSSHKSLPENGDCFSNVPFAESTKVHSDCGKIKKLEVKNVDVGCEDVVKSRMCAVDEKFERVAVEMSSNGHKCLSAKSEVSQNADENSGGDENINEGRTFGKDERLTYDQLLMSSDFSVSSELEKAIEMLAMLPGGIHLDSNPRLPSFRTSFEVKAKMEAAYVSRDLPKMSTPCSSNPCGDADVRRNGEINGVNTEKPVTPRESSTPARPKHQQTDDVYCLTTDSGVTVKVYPATNPSPVDNATMERKPLGENYVNADMRQSDGTTSTPKRHTVFTPKTSTQKSGSLIPRAKTISSSEANRQLNAIVSPNSAQKKSNNFPRSLASELSTNQLKSDFISNVHCNLASPKGQIARNLVQHTPIMGGRIHQSLPSPSVQRTAASKIEFFTRQEVK